MVKNISIIVLLLIASRFIGLPANFSPLLALAVVIPRVTPHKFIQYLLPVAILLTMALVFLVTPLISSHTNNLALSCISAVLIWHFFVNGAVWMVSGGSILETYVLAIPFDFKLLISTGLYVALFAYAEKMYLSFRLLKS
jgi:hypothetical protein